MLLFFLLLLTDTGFLLAVLGGLGTDIVSKWSSLLLLADGAVTFGTLAAATCRDLPVSVAAVAMPVKSDQNACQYYRSVCNTDQNARHYHNGVCNAGQTARQFNRGVCEADQNACQYHINFVNRFLHEMSSHSHTSQAQDQSRACTHAPAVTSQTRSVLLLEKRRALSCIDPVEMWTHPPYIYLRGHFGA
ncbi:unnamed protein product [Timema podura]|uniref:Uncharacterized protein n=1 Tax=Timema podura TaxID=61482 RepID=A0ABN7PE88_TIMPD|nr:unnamed protein product [Timema podura]